MTRDTAPDSATPAYLAVPRELVERCLRMAQTQLLKPLRLTDEDWYRLADDLRTALIRADVPW